VCDVLTAEQAVRIESLDEAQRLALGLAHPATA